MGWGMGGKCSHHCATNKCGPSSIPVLSVICGLSWLLVLVLAKGDFFNVSGYSAFPLSSKTIIFKFQFDLDSCQAL